ncbi:MAG: hypothetical protein JWL72_2816 [Ilumatobacteraceae bacterium]|nr:hypothetical protein [Ilumatobacteraceae bacterium]
MLFSNYFVCGYTLNIEPQNDQTIHIAATIETDVAGSTTSYRRI